MSSLILLLNKVFRPPHVEGRESEEAYSDWEYRWGKELVREFLEPAGDLSGKTVLDVGCGFGGKTVAYAEAGATRVVGMDIMPAKTHGSQEYARRHAPGGPWSFLTSDVSELPFADGTFDTVVANDAMEHFWEPERALAEMSRVTRPGGVIWIFYTPHYSPLGSHLYDYIYTPWCHLVFTRSQIRRSLQRVLGSRLPDWSSQQIAERVDDMMVQYDRDLNHMSVRWFQRIVRGRPELRVAFRELRPAKFGFLKPLTRVPMIRELITGLVVCRLERSA